MSSYLVEPGRITWDAGSPISDEYDDIYWHRGAPLQEKSEVFVQPLLSLIDQATGKSQVTVCELGFGFGINCLLTAKAWQKQPTDHQLNFVSIERHPVSPNELEKFLADLDFPHTQNLLQNYPPPLRGQHVIWLADNIRLILIFEDADKALANLDANVDCWYLDGFAPAKNDAMWQPSLYRKMFARSRNGAIVVTYSSAGAVRRGLEQAGFHTKKRPGFGQKREMLSAFKPGEWRTADRCGERISIVGAGLSGLFCAEALQRRNIDYQLFDSGAVGPSAIPQLSVLPQIARAAEVRYRFSLAACQYMQNAPGFNGSGLQWIGRTDEETARLEEVARLFPDTLIEQRQDGVWFHQAGWLSFKELKESVNPNITTTTIKDVESLTETDQVILATGFNRSLLPEQLQVRAIRGQAIEINTSNISHVINGQATIFPSVNDRSIISGTYERVDHTEVSEEETQSLLDTARQYISVDDRDVQPWTGVRAVSRDRLPIVGQAPDWQEAAKANRISALQTTDERIHYCTAFASRGATHARLCAEHLVSKILGEPAALGLEEQHLLSPARFLIRDNNAAN